MPGVQPGVNTGPVGVRVSQHPPHALDRRSNTHTHTHAVPPMQTENTNKRVGMDLEAVAKVFDCEKVGSAGAFVRSNPSGFQTPRPVSRMAADKNRTISGSLFCVSLISSTAVE